MTDTAPKIAILGRPGPAREHLHRALADLGGEIAVEGEPGDLNPEDVIAAQPSVVVVSLDPVIEDQLEAWEGLFATDGVNVVFDDAETTSQLDGWDLARWARHLAAKILGNDQTLPPPPDGAEGIRASVDWLPSPGGPPSPASQMDGERLEDYAVEALDLADSVPVADDPRRDGDGQQDVVGIEWDFDDTATAADDLELDADVAALAAGMDAAPEDGPLPTSSDDAGEAGAGDILEFEPVGEESGSAASLDADGDRPAPPSSALDAAAAPIEVFEFEDGPGPVTTPDTAEDAGEDKPDEQMYSFGRPLELLDDDADEVDSDAGPGPGPGPVPVASDQAPPADDGMSLDDLAAAFGLDDAAGDEDAVAEGVVVLLAGMGGPDALRQMLSALPPKFAVPVLVWQQLNAGTHDRLASQLAKTGKVDTYVARVDGDMPAGKVGILPPGVGVSADDGLRFIEDDTSPRGLLGGLRALGSKAVVVALSGAEDAWLEGSAAWTEAGGQLLVQSPETCFEAATCQALANRGVDSGQPAELATRALARWHEDY